MDDFRQRLASLGLVPPAITTQALRSPFSPSALGRSGNPDAEGQPLCRPGTAFGHVLRWSFSVPLLTAWGASVLRLEDLSGDNSQFPACLRTCVSEAGSSGLGTGHGFPSLLTGRRRKGHP